MKRTKKIWIIASSAVVVLAALGTWLGIWIPQLLNQQKIDELIANQVKPSEGNGSYLHSQIKNAVAGEVDSSFGTIETVADLALSSQAGYKSIADNQISNFVTEFFRNFKGSDAYAQRYKTWVNDINTSFNDLVQSYKDQYGSNWEFYFQAKVLDPAGGNEADWKRNQLFSKTFSAFDDFIFQNYYINALSSTGSIIKPTSTPTGSLKKYLYSADLVNGATTGERNKVVFQPDVTSSLTTPYANAIAKFQEYVFDEYVRDTLPLVTSMVLYKHTTPQTDSKSNFFNVAKAKIINDVTTPTDVVGTEAAYKWQAFDVSQSAIDNPTGTTPTTTTDKFINFVNKLGADYNNNPFVNATTGAITIPATLYTDDSSTLYYIKTTDVFNSSYAQYAAAANYKFNTILGVTDANVPTTEKITVTQLNNKNATEIMNNFMKSGSTSTTGYFTLPTQVKDILNTDPNYNFEGSYNGVTEIADTINIGSTTKSPFIMTRDEAGVHIIGIDRYSKIVDAATYDGKINEIKNTILWRHILGEFGENTTTGFSLDLKSELKTYFTSNRTELLYKFIVANETTPAADNDYIFSKNFTDVSSLPLLKDSYYFDYVNAWIDYSDYLAKTKYKATIKEKILGIQSDYLTHIYGNSVVNNGIAGVLPYTRNTTVNASPTAVNKGIVDNNYGTYDSLNLVQNGVAGDTYSEVTAQTKLNAITTTTVPALYSAINTAETIGMKTLTYPSAQYNQYFLVGVKNPAKNSTSEYINDGDLLNASISSWISESKTKNMVEIEKIVADINYATTTNIPDIYNPTTVALGSTYTDPTTVAAIPAIPASAATDEVKTTYVNAQLQNAYDLVKKLPAITGELKNIANNSISYSDLQALARNTWAQKYLASPTDSTTNFDYLKDISALKYGLDYDEATGAFDLTKFRDYLINQTVNNGKAAFVWQASDKINLIKDYAATASGIANHFTYQTDHINKDAGAYGYAYQGAPNNYRDATTKMWNSTVTFNNKASYYNLVPLENKTGSPSFTGFLGMQFENNTSSELISQVKSDLFSGSTNVYTGYDAAVATTTPATADINIQGVLYNYGSRAEFATAVNNQIYSWLQINDLANWLQNTFGIDVSLISRTSIPDAKDQLIKIVQDTAKLPEAVFTPNKNALLVNSTISIVNPDATNVAPYYFEESEGYFASAVFTQFNYKDVLTLFDVNADGVITSDDKGINWYATTTTGFLNSSAEAFFISAFNWYQAQPAYTSTAYDSVLARQGKVYVYDRRLNDQLGKTLVQNYKENKTGQ